MSKPVIGITCRVDWQADRQMQNDSYMQAILKAGGTPVLLPAVTDDGVIEQHLQLVDGLLISGGPDIDPQLFGEQPIPRLGAVNPLMDEYEMKIIKRALAVDKPLLGICRGVQVLNAAAGGTLYQDIYTSFDSPLKHRQEAPASFPTHKAKLTANTQLAQLMGTTEILVNTFHHQSVAIPAPGFVVNAVAEDGVIEGIESTEHPFAHGVQWHPEKMWNVAYNYDPLFNAFIEAAKHD
ncbi:MAG: gamma-glutamyl-gamma-aminobutyrate hydrolase family protein [Bacillota bacterium]|jgi:putative glutamine amidotransferase